MSTIILDTLPSQPPAAAKPLPANALARLRHLAELPAASAFSIDYCALCPFRTNTSVLEAIGPDGAVYSAPLLLLHYVLDHGYVPPAPFLDALMRGVRHDEARRPDLSVGAGQYVIEAPRGMVRMDELIFKARARFDKAHRIPLDVMIELGPAPLPVAGEAEALIEALVDAVAARAPERPAARGSDAVNIGGGELHHPGLRERIARMRILRMRSGPSMWAARLARTS